MAIKHKISRYVDTAVCGARRVDGAEFAWKLARLTCPGCLKITLARRAAAKARFAVEVPR